jgi:hypothetical protein
VAVAVPTGVIMESMRFLFDGLPHLSVETADEAAMYIHIWRKRRPSTPNSKPTPSPYSRKEGKWTRS